jgi:hypothetical protein
LEFVTVTLPVKAALLGVAGLLLEHQLEHAEVLVTTSTPELFDELDVVPVVWE